MIKLNFAHLCEQAYISNEAEKASIIGIFRSIRGRPFPLEYPKITVVIGITAIEEEEGEHKMILKMIREDEGGDQEIKKMEIPVNILKMEQYRKRGYLSIKEKREQEVRLVVNFEDIIFEKPGRYYIKIFFDKEEIHSLPFDVRLDQK